MNNLPEFHPQLPPHLLAEMDPKDRYLHEQLDVTRQLVGHVAERQVVGETERRELLVAVRSLQSELTAHAASDAEHFNKQVEWQRVQGEKIASAHGRLRWLDPSSYVSTSRVARVLATAAGTLLAAWLVQRLLQGPTP